MIPAQKKKRNTYLIVLGIISMLFLFLRWDSRQIEPIIPRNISNALLLPLEIAAAVALVILGGLFGWVGILVAVVVVTIYFLVRSMNIKSMSDALDKSKMSINTSEVSNVSQVTDVAEPNYSGMSKIERMAALAIKSAGIKV